MIFKKSVVLSAVDNSLKKAVVNLDSKSGTINGEVKLYNFIEEPTGVLSLGLLIDGKVQKVGLTRVAYMTYTFGSIFSTIPENCSCALISSHAGLTEAILLGTISNSNRSGTMEERLIASLNALQTKQPEKVEKILNENHVVFDNEEDVEKEIDECLNQCDKCYNCTYKKYFYETPQPENIFNNEFNYLQQNQIESKNKINSFNNTSENNFYYNDNIKTNSNFNNYLRCDDIKNDSNLKESVDFLKKENINHGNIYNTNIDLNQPNCYQHNSQPINKSDEEIYFDNVYNNSYVSNKQEDSQTNLNNEKLNETKKNIRSGRIRKPENEESNYFFNEISSQLNLLFDKYPPEKILEEIIPNSKWVRVDFEEDAKFYVVGLIYIDNQVKYVCYGIPAKWSSTPPKDFNENAQWLPINVSIPHGDGYWITYQDAIDGEMVKVDIV